MTYNQLTTPEYIKKVKLVYGDRYDYSKTNYINSYTNITIICPIHGEFLQKPYNHSVGKGCIKCRGENSSNLYRKTKEQFIEEAKKIHGDKYNYSLVNYKKNSIKIKIICKNHGIFEQRPYSHLHGQGCPKCKQNSKGENLIRESLIINNIQFIEQKRFWNCKGIRQTLPFDFYLPKQNMCIEYDGIQHFDKTSKFYTEDLIRNDNIKNKYCKDNNINLLRISFLDIENINIIVENVL